MIKTCYSLQKRMPLIATSLAAINMVSLFHADCVYCCSYKFKLVDIPVTIQIQKVNNKNYC